MFPQAYRLTESPHIQRVITEGKTYHSPLFVLKYLKVSPHESVSRRSRRENFSETTTKVTSCSTQIATITSSKRFRLAVDRNLARRRLRQHLYHFLDQLVPNHHLVFILKPPILTIPSNRLNQELISSLQRTSLTQKL